MSRILAYKCKGCSALFEDGKDYKSHVRKEAAELRKWRKQEQKCQDWSDFLAQVKLCSSFEDIEQWFVENGERIIQKLIKDRHYGPRWKPGDGISVVKFSRMQWSKNCSNSHRAPEGKPTNWCARDKSLPTGYPGWAGWLKVRMPEKFNLGSDVFAETIIHTGSGGGGGGGGIYEHEVTIFAEEALALFTMEKLKGHLDV